jgi:hypothetical protein
MKTTTINSIEFEFKKFDPVYNWKTSIYNLYEKPSQEKIKIFNDWKSKLTRIY